MRFSNVLFSIVHLCVALFVLGIGSLFLLASYAPKWRFLLSKALIENPASFYHIGLGLILFGILLFTGFYYLNKRQYFTVVLNNMKFSSTELLIKESVYRVWPTLFPEHPKPEDVYLNASKQIELILPIEKNEEKQQLYLKIIEDKLSPFLKSQLGYEKPIIVHLF